MTDFIVEPGQVPDDENFWMLFRTRQWEPQLLKILETKLTPDMTYIDVGAWIGPTTLKAATVCDHVYAVEPDKLAFEALNKNISLNPELAKKIRIDSVALSCAMGQGYLVHAKGISTSMLSNNPEIGGDYLVNTMSITNYLSMIGVTKVDFIKVDIEGGETMIIDELDRIYESIGCPMIYLALHQGIYITKETTLNKIFKFMDRFKVSESLKEQILREDNTDVFLEMNPITIQDDYWTCSQCLDNETPWLVPGAIHELNRSLTSEDTVLEVGTGGSTLFYARRCKHVLAIETDPVWAMKVMEKILEKNITNITYVLMGDESHICNLLSGLDDRFNIVSVDTVHYYNRSRMLSTILSKERKLKMIIMDNFTDKELYPQVVEINSIATTKVYTDDKWCGSGTQLIYLNGKS